MDIKAISEESPSHRSYFYVGGQYIDDGNGESQHILTGQMYVEKLIPMNGVRHRWPLVFIHGAGQTGTVSLASSSCFLIYQSQLFDTNGRKDYANAVFPLSFRN